MGVSLLMVPTTCWVPEVDMFDGTDTLVLDNLLVEGLAGAVFKRLRLAAAIHPAVRAEYDEKRHKYLLSVLPGLVDGLKDVVVVGTHPTDVDLMDFQSVAAVQVADGAIRELSKSVYGDALMLQIEYANVLRSVGDAVDRWFHVVNWREISVLVVRQYPMRSGIATSIAPARQRSLLMNIWNGQSDIQVWMEDELHLDMRMRKGFLVADYDYLTVLRPKWRDAVVRQLGAAPMIERVFKLPWFVVDVGAMNALCYRTNANGLPAVSMRGRSLVEFVRTKLSTVLTARELVGTWVGSLLSDAVTAVDTSLYLASDTILSNTDSTFRDVDSDAHAVKVPLEYAWMYSAVPDVVPSYWSGERGVNGMPIIRNIPVGWALTLPLATIYSGYSSTVSMSAEIVRLMYRLHTIGSPRDLLARLNNHAEDIFVEGPTAEVFDPGLTMILPGYNYLNCFPSAARQFVVGQIGLDPVMLNLLEFAARNFAYDALVSLDELYAEACRTSVISGYVWQPGIDLVRVGYNPYYSKPGYCYECLFAPVHRDRIKEILGPYPMLADVMDLKYAPWWIPGALDLVHVVSGIGSHGKQGSGVIHFTMTVEGVALRTFIRYDVVDCVGPVPISVVRVGDDGKCYGIQTFIAMIIAWTIVGVAVVAFFARMLYMRCGGGTQTSGGMYNRRY